MLLPLVAAGRAIAWQRDNRRLFPSAAALLRAIAGAATATQPHERPVHEHLAVAWKLDETGADIVRRALVLLADHELNASAFAVRVVASTGASLGACLNAGLSAFSGPLHGGTTSRVEILFEEVDKAGDAAPSSRRACGAATACQASSIRSTRMAIPARPRSCRSCARTGRATRSRTSWTDSAGRLPNIDFALVSLRRVLGLPQGARSRSSRSAAP